MAETAATLSMGDAAPGFSAPRDGGGSISLHDFAGRHVVLYFYPRDDTSGCTKEAVEFSALAESFAAEDTVVIGVSKDSVKKHDKFRDKHDLTVILVSDETTSICEDYGVWKEKSMYGKTYMGIERSTFLIGPDGRIAEIWPKVKPAGHAQTVLDRLRALKAEG